MKKALILVMIVIAGCNSKTKQDYILTISLMDGDTKYVTEIIKDFKAYDDTTAFKAACSQYWAEKSVRLELNKKLERRDPVPFFFKVETKNGMSVSFDKEEAERLTIDVVKYYTETVMPRIDTITPLSRLPKSEPPKIY